MKGCQLYCGSFTGKVASVGMAAAREGYPAGANQYYSPVKRTASRSGSACAWSAGLPMPVNQLRILTPNRRWVKKFYIDIAHCFC